MIKAIKFWFVGYWKVNFEVSWAASFIADWSKEASLDFKDSLGFAY